MVNVNEPTTGYLPRCIRTDDNRCLDTITTVKDNNCFNILDANSMEDTSDQY
jgi:hypothetical protein